MNADHYQALSAAARRVVDISAQDGAFEADISQAIRIVLGDPRFYPDVYLHPNPTGVLVDPESKRHVRFGAGGPGGGDFMGMLAPTGRHLEAEIKRRSPAGRQSEEQRQRQALVERFGGAYRVLRSVDDAEQWIRDLRGGKQ